MNDEGIDELEPDGLGLEEDPDDRHLDHQLEDQDGVDDGETDLHDRKMRRLKMARVTPVKRVKRVTRMTRDACDARDACDTCRVSNVNHWTCVK